MKFIEPAERWGPSGPHLSRSQIVRDIMAEKERARYIPLRCGHMTTWETVELYSHLAPKNKNKEYCEICGRWVVRQPKPKRQQLPDDPSVLF